MRGKKKTAVILEETYKKFHHRKFVTPDPLQFLYLYDDIRDREIVGLICSSLALGRVSAIIDIIGTVLDKLPSPFKNLTDMGLNEITILFTGFKYRFYKDSDIISLLMAIKTVIRDFGSLNQCFLSGFNDNDQTIQPALINFCQILNRRSSLKMIADPSKNSACKRLMLYMRWMIREDEIDPGGWTGVGRDKLIVPLDTHIFKISKMFHLTTRNDAGMKTALEITENLRNFDKADPIRFDFSLTRPGIHPDLDYDEFENHSP